MTWIKATSLVDLLFWFLSLSSIALGGESFVLFMCGDDITHEPIALAFFLFVLLAIGHPFIFCMQLLILNALIEFYCFWHILYGFTYGFLYSWLHIYVFQMVLRFRLGLGRFVTIYWLCGIALIFLLSLKQYCLNAYRISCSFFKEFIPFLNENFIKKLKGCFLTSFVSGHESKALYENLPYHMKANERQLSIVASSMIPSHSVFGDLQCVDTIIADILRKELEHETFA